MKSIEKSYGITVLMPNGSIFAQENGLALFETMSGIKSIIGTLAIDKAAGDGQDLDRAELYVTGEHDSNGHGELKQRLKEEDKFAMSIKSLLKHNVADSDCVATNVLIDYLGDKEAINSKIVGELGIVGIELVTDRIRFDGVDHHHVPFQVGKGTMRDFAEYYRRLWGSGEQSLSAEHAWHKRQHYKGKTAKLFGVEQSKLPNNVDWAHKTGSGDDVRSERLYSTVMDAGELQVDGKTFYVAAALTLHHAGEARPSREEIAREFANKNMSVLPA